MLRSSLVSLVFIQLFIKSLMAKYMIESTSMVPDYAAVAILNKCAEFHLNAHVDVLSSKHGWLTDHYASSCSPGAKDAFDYCQRVYPGLGVVNVLKIDHSASFTITWCDDDDDDNEIEKQRCRTVSGDEKATVYKCLHGTYAAVNLYVPENCSFAQFSNTNDCPTDVEWTRLMSERCAAARAYLRDFRFMQWCNALNTGARLSSFGGVEFVCCNLTVAKASADTDGGAAATGSSSEEENIDYVNEEESSSQQQLLSPQPPQMLPPHVDVVGPASESSSLSNEDEDERHGGGGGGGGSSRVFTLLLAFVIVVGVGVVVVKRRRAMKRKSGELMVPVNPDSQPPDHVNSMQVNGYENPTYRYFELQS